MTIAYVASLLALREDTAAARKLKLTLLRDAERRLSPWRRIAA